MRLRHCLWPVASGAALLFCAPAAAAAPHTYTIVIDKMKYGPLPAQLHKGDAIIWVNRDFLRHTVTATDHSFNLDLVAGAKGKIVVAKSGNIPFFCRYHPGMRGVLQVK